MATGELAEVKEGSDNGRRTVTFYYDDDFVIDVWQSYPAWQVRTYGPEPTWWPAGGGRIAEPLVLRMLGLEGRGVKLQWRLEN